MCVRPITYMNTNTCQVRKKWRRGKRKPTITKTAKSLEAQMVMWQYAGTAPVVWFVREHLPGRRSPRPHCHATRGRHLAASSSGNLPCFCCHLGPSVHTKKTSRRIATRKKFSPKIWTSSNFFKYQLFGTKMMAIRNSSERSSMLWTPRFFCCD